MPWCRALELARALEYHQVGLLRKRLNLISSTRVGALEQRGQMALAENLRMVLAYLRIGRRRNPLSYTKTKEYIEVEMRPERMEIEHQNRGFLANNETAK